MTGEIIFRILLLAVIGCFIVGGLDLLYIFLTQFLSDKLKRRYTVVYGVISMNTFNEVDIRSKVVYAFTKHGARIEFMNTNPSWFRIKEIKK